MEEKLAIGTYPLEEAQAIRADIEAGVVELMERIKAECSPDEVIGECGRLRGSVKSWFFRLILAQIQIARLSGVKKFDKVVVIGQEVLEQLKFASLATAPDAELTWLALHTVLIDFYECYHFASMTHGLTPPPEYAGMFNTYVRLLFLAKRTPPEWSPLKHMVQAAQTLQTVPEVYTRLVKSTREAIKAGKWSIMNQIREQGDFQYVMARAPLWGIKYFWPLLRHELVIFDNASPSAEGLHTSLALLMMPTTYRTNAFNKLILLLFRFFYRRIPENLSLVMMLRMASELSIPPFQDFFAHPTLVAMRRSMLVHYRNCLTCGKQPLAAKLCSKCKEARYCSPECQKQDWSGHKSDCGKVSLKERTKLALAEPVPLGYEAPPVKEILAQMDGFYMFNDADWQPYSD